MPKRPKPITLADVTARVVRSRPKGQDDGRWYWRLIAKRDGTETTIPGGGGWYTVREAELKVAEAAADRTPARLAREALQREGIGTVRTLAELWLGVMADDVDAGTVARRTLMESKRCMNRWAATNGRTRLDHVTTGTLADHRNRRKAEGASAATILAELQALTRAMKWARRERYTTVPIPEVPRVNGLESRAKRSKLTPTPAEVDAVLTWLRAYPGKGANPTLGRRTAQRTADVLEVMRIYGARIREVTSLTGASLDHDAQTITFVGKTGTRVLPLSERVVALVAPYDPSPDGYVWASTPATVERYVWRYLHMAQEALEAPEWRPHGLRRLFADEADQAGATPVQVAAWLGNSGVTVLRDYRRVQPRELADVACRVGVTGSNVVDLAARRA